MSDLTQTHLPLRAKLQNWGELPLFPADFAAYPDDSLLDRVYLTEYATEELEETFSAALAVAWEGVEEINFPLLNTQGIALVLGGGSAVEIGLGVTFAADRISFAFTTRIALRFDTTLIRPVVLENGVYQAVEDGTYEIAFENATVTLDTDGNLSFENLDTVEFAPFAIGDTGVVVVPGAVTLCFGADEAAALMAAHPDAELTADFRGVFIADGSVVFPEDVPIDSVSMSNAFIGNQGFSGSILAERGDAGLTARGTCAGFPFRLTSVGLTFVQNAITACAIGGTLTIPFIDKTVDVTLGLGLDGALTIAVADEQGIATLDIAQVGTLKLTSLGFTRDDQGVGVLISGSLLLSVGDLQWPEIIVQSLCIRPGGEVSVPGGWIDLQTPLAVDLFGFRLEMSAIGFGKESDGRSWIGFSGGLNLIDLLPTGVSVEGLRILWNPDGTPPVDLTLQGVGIELTTPGVAYLNGNVSLLQDGIEHYFMGSATLELFPLGITIDASVKIGHDSALDYNYVYVFLSLELPVGIPLWATGAAVYGIAGLLGINVQPDTTNGDWYGWYAAPPEFNITDASKWRGELGGMAFGAGIVIGTLFDSGWTVSTKSLLALLLPGPVILFNGKANVLQFPPGLLDNSEASLNLLALMDANAGDLLLNIDAGWELKQVIDLSASAEAYFQFSRPDNWHLYLGQDKPETRRIRAYVLTLFNADAYLMIDNNGIAAGFRVSYGQDWRFGPVGVALNSWIEAGAALSWQPVQLEGSLSLGGEFSVSLAGFSIGISAEATLSGKTPKPYWVRGELDVRVNLPAPIKDLEEDILLEWKQDQPPALEDPLRSLSLEHLKVSETWSPALSSSALMPTDSGYDPGPIVPLDAHPLIVFDRSVLDHSGLNNVNATYGGSTRIGDYSFDYELEAGSISLEMWSKAGAGDWTAFSSADLDGAWTAELDGTGKASSSKLQIMAKTPFAFTRRSSRTYADWFLTANPNWPCGDGSPATLYCVDWRGQQGAASLGMVYSYENLTFISAFDMGLQPAPRNTDCRTDGTLGLWFVYTLWVQFPEPIRRVELCLEGPFEAVRAYAGGVLLAHVDAPPSGATVLEASGIEWIEIVGLTDNGTILASVCYTTEAEAAAVDTETTNLETIEANALSWSSDDQILPPDTYFRLTATVKTTRKRSGQVDEERSYTHYAYFQTAAPPALTPAWELPALAEAAASALQSGQYPQGDLADLRTYIASLIPAHGQRAVYRAYDIGAEFNENYVEQMYGADMVVRLRDGNDQPILDENGAEIQFANQWARLPTSELSITEIPYISRVENCIPFSVGGIASNQTFSASHSVLFAAETLYRAELAASYVLFQAENWPSAPSEAGWLELSETDGVRRRMVVIGQDAWEDYCFEATFSVANGERVGFLVRFQANANSTFQCYRLLFNPADQSLRLALLSGSLDLGSNTYTVASRETLWDCAGASCGIDFTLSEHDLALTCEGDQLSIEIDGTLVGTGDGSALTSGKIGLYYNGADPVPTAFAGIVLRSAPCGKIYGWQFSTSAYPGFVEHLDSFAGVVYSDETLHPAGADVSAVMVEAAAALSDANNTLSNARADLALADALNFTGRLAVVVAARDARDAASASSYQALFRLFFGDTYRPRPPIVELTELLSSDGRAALLLESREPLDWNRVAFTLKRMRQNGDIHDLSADMFFVWSDDGTRALLMQISAASLPSGSYELQLAFSLDIGAEAPVLRRNGSTIPEAAALHFDLRSR